MRCQPLISLFLAPLVALAIAPACNAQPFDPATQSHEGACSVETTNVRRAVGDYAANRVLSDFAKLIGVKGSGRSLRGAMSRALVVGFVRERVVTANHGCNGEGDWFAVGPRTLYRGEPVGVKVPGRLRSGLCQAKRRGCRLVTLKESVVFPITCWNPNFGSVDVGIYVRKPKKPKRHVKPAKESAPPPVTTPAPSPVTPTPAATPTPTPVADPAASAAQQSCSAGGGVAVTLSNASTATASASFIVNEKTHGPIAPGGSEQVTIALAPGASTKITVSSGGSVLIDEESFTDDCKAEPAAEVTAEKDCKLENQTLFDEIQLELSNAVTANLPASFLVEWTSPALTRESKEYGPLEPGESETVSLEDTIVANELKVTSGGEVVLEEEFPDSCLA